MFSRLIARGLLATALVVGTSPIGFAQAPAAPPAAGAPPQAPAGAKPPALTISGTPAQDTAKGASLLAEARKALGGDEKIDDVLISLTSQVQIIHPLPSNPSIFTYLIGDRSKSSLAMARYKAAEADLLIQL